LCLAGDFLLVGIDRRNDPAMVAAAYNDKQGIWDLGTFSGLVHSQGLAVMRQTCQH
jgi:hypothetical protein